MPNVYSLRKGSPAPPPGAVYVGRPNARRADCPINPWFNPFRVTGHTTSEQAYERQWACAMFEDYALDRLKDEPGWLEPLRDKDLICWCAPLRCHADILLILANREQMHVNIASGTGDIDAKS